jgi:hypothetical protein
MPSAAEAALKDFEEGPIRGHHGHVAQELGVYHSILRLSPGSVRLILRAWKRWRGGPLTGQNKRHGSH